MENAETAETAEGPAPAPTAEGPAPAATLERPHSKNKEKSTDNFGRPASTNSDFYIWTLFEPGLVDTQYNIDFLRKPVNNTVLAFRHTVQTHRASRPATNIYSYRLTSNIYTA